MQNTEPYHPHRPWEELPNSGLALVFGILSICVSFVCGCIPVGPALAIAAILNAREDRKRYRAEPGKYTLGSYNRSTGGLVTGIIGLVLYMLGIFLFVGMMALGFFASLGSQF